MAVLTVEAFKSKWGIPNFPSDGLRSITGARMRDFKEDIADSFLSVIGSTAVTAWKDPCIVATTVNITLSGEQTIDGVLTSASRVLVKNQNDQEDNGIYISSAGAWARSTDSDSAAEVEGAAVGVTQGTVGQNSIWLQTSDNVTLGTTPLIYQQIGFGVSSQSLNEVLSTGNDGGGLQIKNIADPTLAQDAATKAYTDTKIGGSVGSTDNAIPRADGTGGKTLQGGSLLFATDDGRFYGTALHNNAGSVTGTTNQYIASGTFTPTSTNIANADSSTPSQCRWTRVGNNVRVSGEVSIDPTTLDTNTEIRMTLPIASNISAASDLSGVGFDRTTTSTFARGAAIYGDATNNEAFLRYIAGATTARVIVFNYEYEVL